MKKMYHCKMTLCSSSLRYKTFHRANCLHQQTQLAAARHCHRQFKKAECNLRQKKSPWRKKNFDTLVF